MVHGHGELVGCSPRSGAASDDSLLTAATAAQAAGLAVAIAPHIDVLDGTFRGEIEPDDREAWFDSYARMLGDYAALAEEAGASRFIVGTELTSMSVDEDQFRELIALVRERFSGAVTYGANWIEEAEQVKFWDALDLIAVDAYMPLRTESETPSVDELVEAWQPYVERAQTLHDGWGLPVEFAELGYASRLGTAAAGGQPADGSPDEAAQADAYEAAFRAWSGQPWFEGIWWWDFPIATSDPDGGGFTPTGKLAEEVLARWQGGTVPPPSATP